MKTIRLAIFMALGIALALSARARAETIVVNLGESAVAADVAIDDADPVLGTAPPPPPGDNEARAKYDPSTGDFWIMVTGPWPSAQGVSGWAITGNGLFPNWDQAQLPVDLGDGVFFPTPANYTMEPNGVGETRVIAALVLDPWYEDAGGDPAWVHLGAIAPGLDVTQDNVYDYFGMTYSILPAGTPLRDGVIEVVEQIPEPCTVLILASGLLGLAGLAYRRRRAG